jgi:integrase
MGKKLTALGIEALKTPGKYPDGHTPGLYLQVNPSQRDSSVTRRSWVYRYSNHGRTREMGLGPYPAVSLAKAREEADKATALRRQGTDPLQAKATAKVEAAIHHPSFEVAAFKYMDHMVAEKLAKDKDSKFAGRTYRAWKSAFMRFVYPSIGKLPVSQIKVSHITAILEPLTTVKGAKNKRAGLGGPHTAARLRSRIERVLNYAVLKGWRSEDALNPAGQRLIGTLLGNAPKTVNHKAAPLHEVPLIYMRLKQETDTISNAVRFIMTTATRLRETLDCHWNEIDLEKALWVIPKHRVKVDRDFEVPLSSEAIAILKTQAARRMSDVVFPGRYGGRFASSTIAPALKRLGVDNTTIHGFRSSFRDWCGEIGDVPREIAEHALNHRVGGVEGAYRRMTSLEARRRVMEQYCHWLQGVEPASNVVSLKAAATR